MWVTKSDIFNLASSIVCFPLNHFLIPVLLVDIYRVRYGAAELHPVAAFMGGSAAQEVIKIVTKQFIPFNNTFIYNAANASSATFQL